MQVKYKDIVYSDRFEKGKKPAVEIKSEEKKVFFVNCNVDWLSFSEQFLGLKFKWYQKIYLTAYYKLRYFFKTRMV